MFVTFFPQNQWRELSKEDQEPISESPLSSQPQARCPAERYNGNQKGGQQEETGEHKQDGKIPAQPSCKEQELDGSTTQSVSWVWSLKQHTQVIGHRSLSAQLIWTGQQ